MFELNVLLMTIFKSFFILLFYLGIEPWTFVQELGEAVFIPAGCPHQVRNLKVVACTFMILLR